MIYTVPHYFDKFHCIAGKCTDTCCAGWQIVIDDHTLQKYRHQKGAFGKLQVYFAKYRLYLVISFGRIKIG